MKKKPVKFAFQAVIGLAIGITCVMIGIVESSSFMSFINIPSFAITIGGTFAAMVVTFPMELLLSFGSIMKKVFTRDVDDDPLKDIDTIIKLSELARREGILALDNVTGDLSVDEFMKKGVMLVIDGITPDLVRSNMMTELRSMKRRHKDGASMLDMIARTTPSLGLLCTYVGLIPMLQNLTNPESLGPLMAIELVSSFYGSFIAYVLFSPMANRLKLKSAKEALRKEIIVHGIVAISEGVNPRVIESYLLNFLEEKAIVKSNKKKKRTEGGAEPIGDEKKDEVKVS